MQATIYHNPNCSTSRKALAHLRESGIEPRIIEYMKQGWTADQLKALAAAAHVPVAGLLRAKRAKAHAEHLLEDGVSEAELLQAMVQDPALVERPIVQTQKGAVVCRPIERIQDVL